MKKVAQYQSLKLGDILKLEYGKPLPDSKRKRDGAHPAYGANGEINRTDEYYYNKRSIIVGRKGSAGEIKLTEEKFWPLDVTYFVTLDHEKYDLNFIYHLLSSLELPKLAKGVKPGINRNEVYSIIVKIPHLQEQQRIVAILDKAFSVIDKATFNAEQNLKNAKVLFDSYLQCVFENKGEGWKEKDVRDFIEEGIIYKPLDGNHGEIHPLKNDYVDIGIPFIMSRDMEDGSIDEENCKFISEKQARSLRTGFALSGDVLLSHKGTIGSVAILQTKYDFVVLTPQITYYRVKDHSKFINKFIYYQFLSPVFQKAINRIAEGGSTRAYIGITKQLSLKLIIAPLKAQQTIVQKLDALSDETKKLETIYQTKINELEELKKSLLQKAFSGGLSENTDIRTNTKVHA